MELLLFLVLLYASKNAWDQAWDAWRKSRSAYTGRADKRYPGMPRGRRAGHALRHDLGYGLSQARHGFPQARHGFVQGWHQGRQAHVQAQAERERVKAEHLEARARLIPDLREYRRRQKEALEQIRAGVPGHADPVPDGPGTCPRCHVHPCGPTGGLCSICTEWDAGEGGEGRRGGFEPILLTGRSKSGRSLNPITGAPEDTAAVWDQEDLDRRLVAAAEDPDIEVSTRPLPHPETDCDLCGQPLPPGYAGIAHPGCINDCEQDATPSPPEGTDMPDTSGDTTYTQHLRELAEIRNDAEQEVNSVRVKRMMNRLDILSGLGLDSASLSEAAAIDDALQAQQKAAQQTLDAADAAIQGLKQRHGGIQEAVSSSPVDKPAQPEFYQD